MTLFFNTIAEMVPGSNRARHMAQIHTLYFQINFAEAVIADEIAGKGSENWPRVM